MTSPDRRPLVAGNWKMNTTVPEALNLTTVIRQRLDPDPLADVVLLPPFISLWPVQQLLLDDPRIAVGAQDCYWEKSGAYTGSVSAAMLVGSCRYVLVGHSERRRIFGDDDEVVRRKLEAVLGAALDPILAVGESWEERESGSTDAVLNAQTRAGLAGLTHSQLLRCVLAYEPVWAIGTGRTAVPEDVASAIAKIREVVDDLDAGAGDEVRVLYGGSVTASSAAELFKLAVVDGGLIGGASLVAEEFCAIVAAAAQPTA
ncbi:MAG: triose-phosphate isomerase [Candidatus Dormiibacterota bacterium]